jgi:hypothetical protein
MDKLHFITINFFPSKNSQKVKRQPTELEEIFSVCTSDKGPGSRTYKEHLQINNNMANDPITK